jgi:hypothetical protein
MEIYERNGMRLFFFSRLAWPLCLAVAISLICSAAARAHGVTWDYSSKKTVGLVFAYDDDTPMEFAEVKVFGPNDKEKLSQVGRCDQNGAFAFIPATDGEWLVTADDNNGHLAQAVLEVKPTAAPAAPGEAPPAMEPMAVNLDKVVMQATNPSKIGLVVSLFLNVALGFKLKGRRKEAAKPPAPEPSQEA